MKTGRFLLPELKPRASFGYAPAPRMHRELVQCIEIIQTRITAGHPLVLAERAFHL